MAQKFRQIDEGFTWVFKAASAKDKAERLKEWARECQPVVPIVRMGVGAEKPDWNLPEGMPNLTKLQEDIPEGMGQTTLVLEWRRVIGFITPGSNMNALSPVKREQQWINTLEAIHHKEAKILTAVKDGTLLDLYPELEEVLPLIGITEYNKVVKKRTRKNAKTAE